MTVSMKNVKISLTEDDPAVAGPAQRASAKAGAQSTLRKGAALAVSKAPALYQDDYLTVDRENRRVLVKGAPVRLTPTEYRLLAYLIECTGQVLTHEQILARVWGWEYRDSVDYVHVYVSRLRSKLEEDPQNPRYLRTERRLGYRFKAQDG